MQQQLPSSPEFDYLRTMIDAYEAAPESARTTTIALTDGRHVTGPILGPRGGLLWVLGPNGFPNVGREVTAVA
jgi:hypothetical protein